MINRPVVRDGRPYPARSVQEFVLTQGAQEALGRLHAAGWLLIVVTNQPDVERGTLAREAVEEIHAEMRRALPLDDVRVCYHGSDGSCTHRKPLPGMLLAAAADLDVDLEQSFVIGDRWRDVDAGRAAGCRTIFLDYGYDESLRQPPDFVVAASDGLARAVEIILTER